MTGQWCCTGTVTVVGHLVQLTFMPSTRSEKQLLGERQILCTGQEYQFEGGQNLVWEVVFLYIRNTNTVQYTYIQFVPGTKGDSLCPTKGDFCRGWPNNNALIVLSWQTLLDGQNETKWSKWYKRRLKDADVCYGLLGNCLGLSGSVIVVQCDVTFGKLLSGVDTIPSYFPCNHGSKSHAATIGCVRLHGLLRTPAHT